MTVREVLRSAFGVWIAVLFLVMWPAGAEDRPVAAVTPNAGVGPATLGFVFDPESREIRPVFGVPGAASLGAPLELGIDLRNAVPVPGQPFLIGIDAADLRAVLVSWRDQPPAVEKMNWAGPVGRIALNRSGSAAILIGEDGRTVEIVRGIPNRVLLAERFEAPGLVTTAAVSDDGQFALIATAEGEGPSLLLLGAGTRKLSSEIRATGLAFLRDSHDALAVDGSADRLYRIRGTEGTPEVEVLASGEQGLARPVAVGVSADNRRAFVVNDASPNIVIVDAATRESTVLECNCRPTGLYPMAGSSVFGLTGPGDGAVWMLDAEPAAPRLVFAVVGWTATGQE